MPHNFFKINYKSENDLIFFLQKIPSVEIHRGVVLPSALIIFGTDLEIRFRMVTDRANFRCFFTNDDMATVATLPDGITFTRKDNAFLNIGN